MLAQSAVITKSGAPILFDVWCDFKRVRKLKLRTISAYEKRLTKISDWWNLPVDKISKDMVIVRHKEMSLKTPVSANRVFKILGSLLNYADANRIDRRKVVPDNLQRWIDIVLEDSNSIYRDYLTKLLLTGMRKQEAVLLTWERVDDIIRCGGIENCSELEVGPDDISA